MARPKAPGASRTGPCEAFFALGGYVTLLLHQTQDTVAPFLGERWIVVGLVGLRGRDYPRDERCFFEGQLGSVFVEVRARGRLDPIGAPPQIDGVQVEAKDLGLAVLVLELDGKDRFFELPRDRLRGVVKDRVLHVLLRDRGTALLDASTGDVRPPGSHDPPQVDSAVLVVVLVLRGDDGLTHKGRQLGGVDQEALDLARVGADETALPVEHLGRLCHFHVFRQRDGSERVDQRKDAEADQDRQDGKDPAPPHQEPLPPRTLLGVGGWRGGPACGAAPAHGSSLGGRHDSGRTRSEQKEPFQGDWLFGLCLCRAARRRPAPPR